jgi:hypothetical protein
VLHRTLLAVLICNFFFVSTSFSRNSRGKKW